MPDPTINTQPPVFPPIQDGAPPPSPIIMGQQAPTSSSPKPGIRPKLVATILGIVVLLVGVGAGVLLLQERGIGEIREKASCLCDGWANCGETHTNNQDGCSYLCTEGGWSRQSCPGGGDTGGGGSQGTVDTNVCNTCGGIGQGVCNSADTSSCDGSGDGCYGNLVPINGTCAEASGNTTPVGAPDGSATTDTTGQYIVSFTCPNGCDQFQQCGENFAFGDAGRQSDPCAQIDSCTDSNYDTCSVVKLCEPSCVGEQTTTTETPTTSSPPVIPQCTAIKAYDAGWNVLTATQLTQLKVGDIVRFAVLGAAPSGSFTKARFTINGAAPAESALVNPNATGEFYIEYTLPAGITTFTIGAELYHMETAAWY